MIKADSWLRPAIFKFLQDHGAIDDDEMYRTFNCGLGMMLVLPAEDVDTAMDLLTRAGETPYRVGYIEAGAGDPEVVIHG